VDISDLIAQKSLPMAGSPFNDLVARVERKFAVVDAARRMSEGVATAAASRNWLENIQRTINPTQILYEQLTKSYEFARPFVEPHTKFLDYARGPAAGIFSEFQRYNDLFRSFTEQFFDDGFIELELHLINEGWYLSIDLPPSAVIELADLHDEQELKEIDKWLRKFYRERVDQVESAVLSVFPRRCHILEPAFLAHRRKEYALSIPVFLIQIDGISAELWRENFFRTGRSNRQIYRMLQTGDFSVSATVLRHLYERGCLRASFEPGARPSGFNRHAILHGTSTDYNTEENSLRCIALLEFLISLQPLFVGDKNGVSLN
jgi:hypothetical protein